MNLLDETEAIQIDIGAVPFRINALDIYGKVIKDWKFDNKDKCWEAFNEIHDEWWSHKLKGKDNVKSIR